MAMSFRVQAVENSPSSELARRCTRLPQRNSLGLCFEKPRLTIDVIMQRILRRVSLPLAVVVCSAVACLAQAASAQSPATTPAPGNQTASSASASAPPAASATNSDDSASGSTALLIGPGDEMDVTVYGAPDLSEHTRVNSDGNISMPMIGYAHVAGLTSDEAEKVIEARLRGSKVMTDPQVSVFVKEYNNSQISVAGEVKNPGSYSALGPHRLFDILQMAGGPTDKAADKVVVTHRDADDSTTLAISKDPTEMAKSNIELQPGDTVIVPRAGIVYVLGEVNRPGGYVLNSTGGITVLQVVAAAGGPSRLASVGGTRLLRHTTDGYHEEHVDLKRLLRGKAPDITVRNDDILFIPSSGFKTLINSTALLTSLGTSAIYRVPY
jgi:polysaccharide export outer membrane protein